MKASKEKVNETILSYVKWASLNPKLLKANENRPETLVYNCHTVYTRPIDSTGHKAKSLNDNLRNLGVDPIDSVNALIKAEVIVGHPIRGGFSIGFPKAGASRKSSHVDDLVVLEQLIRDMK